MKEFECAFHFQTVIQTHGTNPEAALKNLAFFLTEELKSTFSEVIGTGIDYEPENSMVKEIHDGWYEIVLLWNGSYFFVKADNEEKAKEKAHQMLDESLTSIYQVLESVSAKNRRFQFNGINNEKISDVLSKM